MHSKAENACNLSKDFLNSYLINKKKQKADDTFREDYDYL